MTSAASAYSFILLTGALLVGCGGNTDDGSVIGPGGDDSVGTDWHEMHVCQDSDPSDAISIQSLTVEGDQLVVDLAHGGGCETHEYGICYEESWTESVPVQVQVHVLHEDNGDTCEAYLSDTVEFDLLPLRDAYESAYQTREGVIEMLVGEESALYEFSETSGPGDTTGPAPTYEEIVALADPLNTCAVVEDCKAVPIGCSSIYVGSDADTTALEADIAAYQEEAYGGQQVACIAMCMCGILSCTQGKCSTLEHDCTDPPAGTQSVCL